MNNLGVIKTNNLFFVEETIQRKSAAASKPIDRFVIEPIRISFFFFLLFVYFLLNIHDSRNWRVAGN